MSNGRTFHSTKTCGNEEDVLSQVSKKILVAGGAGFIGSHLCKRLINDGHNVTCLDNFLTGQRNNISGLADCSRFQLIEHDIVEPIFFAESFDQIYNLACPASPPKYQENPVHTLMTSVIGSANLLNLAKEHNSEILLTSTSEVYGDPVVHPQSEGYRGNVNCTGPRACYDEGKRCAETLFFDFARVHGVRIKVARLFNTYGPNMMADDGRVVSNFINQALQDQDITVYGDGKQTRSLCYVDDMVDGLVGLMKFEENFLGPVNLGNPAELRVLDLAKKIIGQVGSSSRIIFKPLPIDDPKRRKPDITLAIETLNWQPSTGLKIGLGRTISYFDKQVTKCPLSFGLAE